VPNQRSQRHLADRADDANALRTMLTERGAGGPIPNFASFLQRFIGALPIRDLVTGPRVSDASFHAASRTG